MPLMSVDFKILSIEHFFTAIISQFSNFPPQ